MAIVTVNKNVYKVDSLYQWDSNQELEIHGLSVPTIPEIHFTNDAMGKAIVRQATMDNVGVITVEIPNSLLQKPYNITAYVCIYEDETFKSLYKIIIPVKSRKMPEDYTIQDDDGEIYSFKALENKLDNTLRTSLERYEESDRRYNVVLEQYETMIDSYDESVQRYTESKENYDTAENLYNDSCDTLDTARTEFDNAKNEYLETINKIAMVKDVLQVDQTEITLSDERIKENSFITVYTSVYGVNPTNVVLSNGSVTLSFDMRSYEVTVGVRIDGDFT